MRRLRLFPRIILWGWAIGISHKALEECQHIHKNINNTGKSSNTKKMILVLNMTSEKNMQKKTNLFINKHRTPQFIMLRSTIWQSQQFLEFLSMNLEINPKKSRKITLNQKQSNLRRVPKISHYTKD